MAIKIKLKKTLEEITRYEKEKGEKYDITGVFKSKITDHPTEYAFTMIKIPKIGINPRTSFNTPAGVYFYPLDQRRYEQLIEDELPYVSNAPYVGLVKLNWDANWLILSKKIENKTTEEDYEKALDYVNKIWGRDIEQEVFAVARHWNFSYAAKIFDLAYFTAFEVEKQNETRFTIAFAGILKSLGYDGIYDDGNQILHGSEPFQLACLTTKAYEPLQVYETSVLRAKSKKVTYRGQSKMSKAVYDAKQKKFWSDFSKLPPAKKIISDDLGTVNINNLVINQGEKILDYLDGAKFLGSAIISIYDTYDLSNLDRMPNNIEVLDKLVLDLNKHPEPFIAHNVKVDELVLYDAKFMPEGIKYTNLNLSQNNTIIELPEGLEVPGNLKLDSYVRKLPNNIKIGGNLHHSYKINPLEFFPENFDFESFTGEIGGQWYGKVSKEKIVDVLNQLKQKSLSESVAKKWKTMIRD